jgi:hypothetical protein
MACGTATKMKTRRWSFVTCRERQCWTTLETPPLSSSPFPRPKPSERERGGGGREVSRKKGGGGGFFF